MQAHQQANSIAQLPQELIYSLFDWLDSRSCIYLLITTKQLYKLLENENTIKILLLRYLVAYEILNAVVNESDFDNNKINVRNYLFSVINKNDDKMYGILNQYKEISLYFANYRQPITPNLHTVFSAPLPDMERTFYLTREAAKKQLSNYSTVQSFSLFKLPLNAINLKMLFDQESICQRKAVECQPFEYSPKL